MKAERHKKDALSNQRDFIMKAEWYDIRESEANQGGVSIRIKKDSRQQAINHCRGDRARLE